MILITGATGTIGSDIVRQLVAEGVAVRAATRDPKRTEFPAGVEVVRVDYRDPTTFGPAMRGIEAAFLVGIPGPDDTGTDAALVAAAREAGVRRVVKLSAVGTGDPRLGVPGSWHVPGEQAVRDSGLEWTILRPNTFASNTCSWIEPLSNGHPVPNLTGEGRQAVVDPRDVSAVAVAALRSKDHHGRTYTLTGPTLHTGRDQAAVLAEIIDRPIAVIDIAEADARAFMVDAGLPPAFVDGALTGQAFIRGGHNELITDDVERVLGRPPRSYATWAADHRAAFVNGAVAAPR
ncbi:NAD(P)-dependent oxidoreductase [Nocardia sp. Root136]|uniref:NAD(P)H-binding protein n=1 Tax=Nocardia sp. Root136 TaxID=1736458 RepID=UPI0006FFD339|nr:NAD(P)H-binding protein [Nocardia sp. Root136]KQY30609.1 NAD(P)-dependent oxidoreductase [Nocardia sp. Root136]